MPAPSWELVGLWNFETQLTNYTTPDSSAYNRSGTLINSPMRTSISAVGNFSLALNASQQQWVALPVLPFAGAETRTLWFRTNSSTPMCLLSLGREANSPTSELRLIRGFPQFFMFTGAAVFDISPMAIMTGGTSLPALNDGHWHHAAVARLGRAVSLYVDGQLVAQRTVSFSQSVLEQLYSQFNTMLLGRRSAPSGLSMMFYDGLVDDVRMYRGCLSDQDIAQSTNFHLYFLPLFTKSLLC